MSELSWADIFFGVINTDLRPVSGLVSERKELLKYEH